MKQLPKSVTFALVAFMAAWQATDFGLDQRAICGAIVAGLMGYLNPTASTAADETTPSE